MTKIETFLKKVEAEVAVALESGILPNAEEQRPALERLSQNYPELDIDPKREVQIIKHARRALNAPNN